MINNTGFAECAYCGAEFRLFTIFNRDMQSLCKIWQRRHERVCAGRTPAQRRTWAQKYVGKDWPESSIVVDPEHEGFKDQNAFDIQVSQDGGTVWVSGSDGSCIGRFSKKFGMDVHRSAREQLAGGKECLHCTHEPSNLADWNEFRSMVELHHQVAVPADLLNWD